MISVELELTTKCQLRCPYCCANSPSRKDVYSDDTKLRVMLDAVDAITDSNSIMVRLMGGEPTMFKHIDHLISRLNANTRVVKLELYTNLMGKIPRGDYITVATIHLGQYSKFVKNIHKIHDLPGICILNVMLPRYREFTQHKELFCILDTLSKTVYIHPQPLAGIADTAEDIELYKRLFGKYNEYFDTLGDYRAQLATFFASRPILCHPDNYRISEDLMLTNDCEYMKESINLMESSDLSMVKHNKMLCPRRVCYADNCVYHNMI